MRIFSSSGVREKIARPIPKGSSRGSALGYENQLSNSGSASFIRV